MLTVRKRTANRNELVGFIANPTSGADWSLLADQPFTRGGNMVLRLEDVYGRDDDFYPIVLTKTTKMDLDEAQAIFAMEEER